MGECEANPPYCSPMPTNATPCPPTPPGSHTHTHSIACVFVQLHWELSGATVHGEGEVKILGRLARPALEMSPDDTHGARPVVEGGGRGGLKACL